MPLLQDEDHRPQRHQLKFRWMPNAYAIVQLQPDTNIPDWATSEFTSITRTAEELSIVCPTENVPPNLRPPQRWTCLKLEGPFPFSQTGILLSFIAPLSENGVPIFAISTYDTDYVLIQQEFSEKAIAMLQQAGHELSTSAREVNL